MAKTATPLFPAPSFKFPEPKLPKLDLEALFAAQWANLDTAQKAQTVLADAAQVIAKVQYGYVEQAGHQGQGGAHRKELPKPEAVLADAKSAFEQTVRSPRRSWTSPWSPRSIGSVELVTQRAQANVSELKALAA